MKAIRWYAPRDMRLEEAEKPVPKPHEALLRIESVGVCGSDMHYYLDGHIGTQQLLEPTILGHEYAGVVEEVGDAVDPALVGKRVAVEPGIPCMRCEWCRTAHYNVCGAMFFPGGPGCDGALCEYYTVHADFCFPVPENVNAQQAAMIEPLAVALHTVELAGLKPGDTAAVLGLGPIGLLTAQLLRMSGCLAIYGADLLPYRAAVASDFGVDEAFLADPADGKRLGGDTLEQIMKATGGRGVDVAFDCTNSSDGLTLTCLAARPAGRCVLTGISGQETDPLPVSVVRRRELNLQWCRRFKNNFPTAIALLASGRVDVSRLITHSFPLEKTNDAFEIVAGYTDNVLKASIDR